MLVNIQTQNQSVTYTGCLTQLCFILVFVGLENSLLAVMAYDRYVAIRHPLRYMAIMNFPLCGQLILSSLFISIVDALLHSLMVLQLTFCTDLEIPLFFCEVVHSSTQEKACIIKYRTGFELLKMGTLRRSHERFTYKTET